MNKTDYILLCIAEEAMEVSQEISKSLRFGLNDTHPLYTGTIHERIERELNDLYGAIELLSEYDIVFNPDEKQIAAKKEKIKKYMEYSKQIGKVHE